MDRHSQLMNQANLFGALSAGFHTIAEGLDRYGQALVKEMDNMHVQKSAIDELAQLTQLYGGYDGEFGGTKALGKLETAYTKVEPTLPPPDATAEPEGMLDGEEIDLATDPDGEIVITLSPLASEVVESATAVCDVDKFEATLVPPSPVLDPEAVHTFLFTAEPQTIGQIARQFATTTERAREALEVLGARVKSEGVKRGKRYSVVGEAAQ